MIIKKYFILNLYYSKNIEYLEFAGEIKKCYVGIF